MVETDDMVGRVAKAISGAQFPSAASRSKARAAIDAMRVPTEPMRLAVWYDQYITCGGTPDEARALAQRKVEDAVQREQDLSSFSALIDAALGSATLPPEPASR